MSLESVLQLINTKIVPNGNNEINAIALQDVLVKMLMQPNDLVGVISNLNTADKTNLVSAINELFNDISNINVINVTQGITNPNNNTGLTPKTADFYKQLTGSGVLVGLWIYNSEKWIFLSDEYVSFAVNQGLNAVQQQTALDNIKSLSVAPNGTNNLINEEGKIDPVYYETTPVTPTRIGVDFNNYTSGDNNFTATGSATIVKNGQNINIHVEESGVGSSERKPDYPDIPPIGNDVYWKGDIRNCLFDYEEWKQASDPNFDIPSIQVYYRVQGDNLYMSHKPGDIIGLTFFVGSDLDNNRQFEFHASGTNSHFIWYVHPEDSGRNCWRFISETSEPIGTEFFNYSSTAGLPETPTNKVVQKVGSNSITIFIPDGSFNGQTIKVAWGGTSNFFIRGNFFTSGDVSEIAMTGDASRYTLTWDSLDNKWWVI